MGCHAVEEVLLFTNAVTVGTVDPVIGKDIGFYLFSLPFLEMLKSFAGFMVLATAVMVGAGVLCPGRHHPDGAGRGS